MIEPMPEWWNKAEKYFIYGDILKISDKAPKDLIDKFNKFMKNTK